MKKITVLIQNNMLIFKYRTNKPVNDNLLNTNVISNDELVFSDQYLKENAKIVGLFICDLASEREINEIKVSNNEIALLIIDIVSKLKEINSFIIDQDDNITYELCEKIIKNKNIKKLDCYGIPQFMIELLDKNGIKVDSRNEVLFTSGFMAENNLTSFSKMYYKTNIRIPDVLTAEDYNDIETFCNINKYLKVVHFDKYVEDNIKKIVEILKKNKRKNIVIQLHDDINDEKSIVTLKNINKELKKKYRIKIVLVYSNDYLAKNYLQQIIFTTIKICAFIIFLLVSSVLGYLLYNNYHSELKVNNIKQELNEVVEESTTMNIEELNSTRFVPGSYDALLTINKDTIGWLVVPGTKIDYPIVQGKDNNYYLTHNFYNETDFAGWLFLDYRNARENLDDNTIIYGHNRFSSGVMFGTLQNLRKKAFFDTEENNYITFNTLKHGYKWQIFSVYGINVTNDYLYNSFLEKTERQKFYNKLVKRSQIKFDVEVTDEDKILTLSTCLDNNKRLVVHAVLVEETTLIEESSESTEGTTETE